MAGEVFIADKQTLDIVKSDTDIIKQNSTYIKNQFPISGGTSWEDYTQFSRGGTYNCSTKKIYNVITLRGVGYLSFLYSRATGYSGTFSNVKIIIKLNDKIIFEEKGIGNENYKGWSSVGFCLRNTISTIAKTDSDMHYSGSKSIGTASSMVNLTQPIFFNGVLEIEIDVPEDNYVDKVIIDLEGGIKA